MYTMYIRYIYIYICMHIYTYLPKYFPIFQLCGTASRRTPSLLGSTALGHGQAKLETVGPWILE